MSTERVNLKLKSVGPLLMNASRLADPLDPDAIKLAAVTSKRKKTVADHRRIAEIEWYGKLWTHEGRPCLPPDALEKVFEDAAKTRNFGSTLAGAVIVEQPAFLEYEGPKDLKKLAKAADFRFRKLVRVSFLATMINREQVVDFFRIAGSTVGIGDWRKKYGRFTIEELPLD
jgi:hypothetical protein